LQPQPLFKILARKKAADAGAGNSGLGKTGVKRKMGSTQDFDFQFSAVLSQFPNFFEASFAEAPARVVTLF
jgi:hypothetical protein